MQRDSEIEVIAGPMAGRVGRVQSVALGWVCVEFDRDNKFDKADAAPVHTFKLGEVGPRDDGSWRAKPWQALPVRQEAASVEQVQADYLAFTKRHTDLWPTPDIVARNEVEVEMADDSMRQGRGAFQVGDPVTWPGSPFIWRITHFERDEAWLRLHDKPPGNHINIAHVKVAQLRPGFTCSDVAAPAQENPPAIDPARLYLDRLACDTALREMTEFVSQSPADDYARAIATGTAIANGSGLLDGEPITAMQLAHKAKRFVDQRAMVREMRDEESAAAVYGRTMAHGSGWLEVKQIDPEAAWKAAEAWAEAERQRSGRHVEAMVQATTPTIIPRSSLPPCSPPLAKECRGLRIADDEHPYTGFQLFDAGWKWDAMRAWWWSE